MKKTLLIIAFLLATQTAHAASLSKPPNNLGLVGYWSFNEGTGLRAGDASGYGNTGTLTGGPTWTAGKLGKALSFDGTDDTVSASGASTLNLSNAITISAWVKLPTGFDNNHKMVVSRYGPSLNWYLSIYLKSPFLSLWIDGVQSFSAGSRTLSAERWHHIVASWDTATDRYKTYLDGVADVDVSMPGTAITSDSGMFIGTLSGADFLFPGSIDEVRVYNRALSNAEVSRLYTSTQATVKGPGSTDDLVGYWPLNDCQRTRATDQSGRGNHGTLNGFSFTGTSSNWVTGDNAKYLCAVAFDGTDNYIDMGDPANGSLDFGTGAFTVSAWFKAPSTAKAAYRTIVAKYFAPGYWIQTDANGYIVAGVSGNVELQGTRDYFDNQWHHVIYTRTGTGANEAFLYVDGVLEDTGTSSDSTSSANSLYIGSFPSLGRYWIGSIDEVRVYSREFTAQEAKALYAGTTRKAQTSSNKLTQGTSLATGLVGHWTFDGADMTGSGGAGTAKDVSGQNNHGTLTNGPARTLGKSGQALAFDGVDDYVDTPSGSTYSFGAGDFTVSFWMKTTDTTGNILSRGPATAADGNWALVLFSSELYWQSRHGVTNLYNRTATSILDGNWHYVVVKRSGTTNTMYFDNVQQGVSVTDTTDYSPANILRIADGANGFFAGSIDDVRIYNRALSATEVKSLYNLAR